MITISLCMIVKNEEHFLRRCLDSVANLCDEIIIVDTGSTDSTKSIALEYTDKVYDFTWENDFSAARNFAFSKATMDYIYSADADEYLDEENIHQFSLLKEHMVPEIEIVQMMYNTISSNTVLNLKKEYRPKLFKRLRTFTWIDPIHEQVRLDPVVFDSDIVITHDPQSDHSARDFSIYQLAIERDGSLSPNVFNMMLTELYKCGTAFDFAKMSEYIKEIRDTLEDSPLRDATTAALCRSYRLNEYTDNLLTVAADKPASESCSEVLLELGLYYMDASKYTTAIEYFEMAAFSSTPVLDIHAGGDFPLKAIMDCCDILIAIDSPEKGSFEAKKATVASLLSEWKEPEEEIIE